MAFSRMRLLTAARSSLAMFCTALPIFMAWPHLDAAYVVIATILVGIIVPSAARIGSAMEQVKVCLASGLLGFLCSIPFQRVIWINHNTPWIGVGWIVVVGFFGSILVTWLDPKMSSLPILRLALLYICVAVTFAPMPSQPIDGKPKHWNAALQMLIIHLYSAAIALVFALVSPFVSSQINHDFANITQNCSILFDEMCDQLRLTKQDSIESDPSLMNISAEQNLLEYDSLRRTEEKKVRALEKYLGRRMKVLKMIMSEAQLELWADPVLVHNHDAIYSNLDRLLRDFVQMRLALETGFIPRLSFVLIQPLIPSISLLRDTTREYLAIINHSLIDMFNPQLQPNIISLKHALSPLDTFSSNEAPSTSTINAHSGIASDSDFIEAHETHVTFNKDTQEHQSTGMVIEEIPVRVKKKGHHHHHHHHANPSHQDLRNQRKASAHTRFDSSSSASEAESLRNQHSRVSSHGGASTESAHRSSRKVLDNYSNYDSSSDEEDENDDDDDREDAEKERRRKRRRERRIQRKQRISISEGTSRPQSSKGTFNGSSEYSTTTQGSSQDTVYSSSTDLPSSSEYHPTSDTDHDHHVFSVHSRDVSEEQLGGHSVASSSQPLQPSPHPLLNNPTLVESETMTLSKQTARITQSISKQYVDTIKSRLSKSELKLSPTAELTRLNFFLWRIAEMRKRLKSLEHAVNYQVRHARALGPFWSLKATFQSIIVPFFSFFQGLVSVLYMFVALFIRFVLWILHHWCCTNVRWENLRWFGRRTQTTVKDPNTGNTVTVIPAYASTVHADPSLAPEHPMTENHIRNGAAPAPSSSALASQSTLITSNTSFSASNDMSSKAQGRSTPFNEFISDLELRESGSKLALSQRPSLLNLSKGSSTPSSSNSFISTKMSSTSAAADLERPQLKSNLRQGQTSMTSLAAQHHAQLSQSQQIAEDNASSSTGNEEVTEVRIELPEPAIAKVGHFRIGKGVKLSDRFIHDWISSGGWRFAVRLAVALAVASAGAMAVQLYAFPKIRVSWVCVTVLIVFAPELGGTMKRVLHRVAGTIGGALCALISVLFAKFTHRFLVFGPFLVFTFIVTYAQHSIYKPRPYTWTVANFTFALIVLVSWPFNESALEYAILAGERALQVLIGCLIVVVASYLIFPDRAETTLRQKLTLQTQHSVHAFIEMIALTHSAIQETGKITSLVQRTWDLIFPCTQLLKLAKAEQLQLPNPARASAKRQTLINITRQLEILSDTLVQMHDTLRAGFSPAIRDWVAPYCELLTRAVLFIEEDALLVYSYLKTSNMEFRPEPTRIPAILQQLDSCYLDLRSSNPHLGDLYPEAFRWNAFMHTAREFIVAFSNLVVYVTESEQHNQIIHMYSR